MPARRSVFALLTGSLLVHGIASFPATAQAEPAKTAMTIVFSKKPITSAKLNAKDPALTRKFELGDAIYARIYVNDGKGFKSHQSSPGNPLNFALEYENLDDGEYKDTWKLVLGDKELQQSFADVDSFSAEAPRQKFKSQTDLEVELGSHVLGRLEYGCKDDFSKTITITFNMHNWGKSAFTLQCSEKGLAAGKEAAQRAVLAFVDSVRMSAPGHKDKKLEAEMARVAEKTPQRSGGGKALRVVITSDDWEIEREAGRIVERYQFAEVAFKRDDPKICYIESVRFAQQHDGRRYLKLQIPGTSMTATKQILCANVKK